MGQADGVACRTGEVFETFGLAGRLLAEAYSVNEVCFWQPDPDDPTRTRGPGACETPRKGSPSSRM